MCYGAAQRYPINVRATGLQQSHLLRTRPLRRHYPRSTLSQIICPMLKDGTIERMTGEITGEERKAPEGTWVLGGGIELPCSYFIYGNRKKKADVRGKLRKAERSLYGI